MPDPLLNIPVQTSGIEDAHTSIAQFAQESTREFDVLSGAVQKLTEAQTELAAFAASPQFAEILQQWKAQGDEIDKLNQRLAEYEDRIQSSSNRARQSASGMLDWVTSAPAGMMRQIPGAAIMQGGLLALILFGAGREDEISTGARVLTQIFEASSSQMITGTAALSEAMTNLEDRTGIAREQTLQTIGVFARLGRSSQELAQGFGDVDRNIVSAAMAFDAWLERPFGTSARDMITLQERFNLSIEETISMYGRLTVTARDSGIGTERFMTAVFDASRQLKTYGVDIENTARMLQGVIDLGQRAGIPREAALEGFGGIVQGLANLPRDLQVLLGQRVFGAEISPLEAIRRLETGFARMGRGGAEFDMDELIGGLAGVIRTLGQGNVDLMYAVAREFRFPPEAAEILVQIARTTRGFAPGDPGRAPTPEERRVLEEALQEEGKKRTALMQATKVILGGIADIGRGIFQLLVSGFASFMGLVTLIVGYISGEEATRQEAIELISRIGEKSIPAAIDVMGQGVGKLGEGVMNLTPIMGDVRDSTSVPKGAWTRTEEQRVRRESTMQPPRGVELAPGRAGAAGPEMDPYFSPSLVGQEANIQGVAEVSGNNVRVPITISIPLDQLIGGINFSPQGAR